MPMVEVAKPPSRNPVRICLILFLVVMIATLVRFLPITGYSPEPVDYAGGSIYSLDQIILTGHTLNLSASKESISQGGSVNVFAGGVVEYAQYPLLPTFMASLLLMCNVSPHSWTFQVLMSIVYALPVMLIPLLLYNSLGSRTGGPEIAPSGRRTAASLLLVSFYSQIGSVPFVTQQGAPGWIFILMTAYLLFFRRFTNTRLKGVALVTLCILPAVYFTAASFFLLWMVVVGLLLLKRGGVSKFAGPILLFGVAYLSYSIYIADVRTASIASVVIATLNTLRNGLLGFTPSGIALPPQYLVDTTPLNKAKYIVNSALVALTVLVFLLLRGRILKERTTPDAMIMAGIVALPLLTVLLFFWLGTLSFGRTPEYGSLVSILAVTALLPLSKPAGRLPGQGNELRKMSKPIWGELRTRLGLPQVVAIIVVLAIVSASVTYVTDENTPYRRITYSEEAAAKWLIGSAPNETVTFTDHRLAGVLVAHGFLRTTGLVEATSVSATIDELNAVYYGNNGTAAVSVIRATGATYVFLSHGMARGAPAIFLYNYPVKPAPLDFMSKYESSPQLGKIFADGDGVFFMVTG
jgi:hypothetical protein